MECIAVIHMPVPHFRIGIQGKRCSYVRRRTTAKGKQFNGVAITHSILYQNTCRIALPRVTCSWECMRHFITFKDFDPPFTSVIQWTCHLAGFPPNCSWPLVYIASYLCRWMTRWAATSKPQHLEGWGLNSPDSEEPPYTTDPRWSHMKHVDPVLKNW